MKTAAFACLFAILLCTYCACAISPILLTTCKHHCVVKKGQSKNLCELYCEQGHGTSRKLEIYDDGRLVTPDSMPLTDQELLNIPQVRFDKTLFNTPSAFDELVKWTGTLQQQVAASSESVFGSSEQSQFHMLGVPIPLTSEQLDNGAFMDRLLDVVPESNLVYKEASPLTFSEAYTQFLLDVKVNNSNFKASPSEEQLAKIKDYESRAQTEMDAFLEKGNRCFTAYEKHLVEKNLNRILYTFDAFGVTNTDCLQADKHMENHENIAKELSEYVETLNPHDKLFKSLGNIASGAKLSWDSNRKAIDSFTSEMRMLESTEQDSGSKFRILLSLARYYFKKEVFGATTQLEESCISANIDFSARGWKEIDVSPSGKWFDASTMEKYLNYPTNSGKNYFNHGGLLQRQITSVIVSYKPVIKFTITSAMKQQFIAHSVTRQRPYEFGPAIFDRVEFNGNSGVTSLDAVEMVMTTNTADPQIIGYRTKPFIPLSIPRASTGELAYCRRENACSYRLIHLIPLYVYWHLGDARSLVTTNYNEHQGGNYLWKYMGVAGYCYSTQHPGTTGLHRYHHPGSKQTYVTSNWNEFGGGRDGWVYQGVICYVSTTQEPNSVPLYKYYNSAANDWTFATNTGTLPRVDTTPFKSFMGMGSITSHYAFLDPAFVNAHYHLQKASIVNDKYANSGVVGYVHSQSAINQAISCCKCE